MVDTIILCGIIVILSILNMVERYNNDKREKNLLNRLMSKDFGAYVQGVKALKKKPEKPITLSDLIQKEDEDILPVD